MEELEYTSADEVEFLAFDCAARPDGTASFTEHSRSVEAYFARLRQTGIRTRAELGVHPVACPCRGDIDPFRHTRHLAVQQQPHRGRQGAVRRAAEQAVLARLHRRMPE